MIKYIRRLMAMKRERRTMVYDQDLLVEAYYFVNLVQAFPEHFHDYYVVGIMEQGERQLGCNGESRLVKPGDMILFNPEDNHSCTRVNNTLLSYRCFHISLQTVRYWLELAAEEPLPKFEQCVINDENIAGIYRECHSLVMAADESQNHKAEKEELFLLLLSLLLNERGGCNHEKAGESYTAEIERACCFIEEHFAENISLDMLCDEAGVSKSTLIRYFLRLKNVTPYRYLASVRVGKAKQMLEQGCSPVAAAVQSGFADQSHFTHCFKKFIGVTPGAYREIFADRQENER